MKHLSVAFIVIALIAADFGATALGFSHSAQSAWSWVDSFGLILGFCWFFFRGDD